MALNQRRKVIAAKIESVYKTDPVPTAAANAMLVRNWKWTPLKLVTDPRELVLPYLRAFEKLVVAGYGTASFEVEMAGSGAAGTAPPWGVLMRACGLSETINAGVDVQYKPASTAFESVTIYFYHEGLLYKLIGVRGTCGLRMNARQVPVFTFEMTGVYVAVTDVALPSPTLTSWQKPLPVSNTNTTGLTLHAFATGVMRSRFVRSICSGVIDT